MSIVREILVMVVFLLHAEHEGEIERESVCLCPPPLCPDLIPALFSTSFFYLFSTSFSTSFFRDGVPLVLLEEALDRAR